MTLSHRRRCLCKWRKDKKKGKPRDTVNKAEKFPQKIERHFLATEIVSFVFLCTNCRRGTSEASPAGESGQMLQAAGRESAGRVSKHKRHFKLWTKRRRDFLFLTGRVFVYIKMPPLPDSLVILCVFKRCIETSPDAFFKHINLTNSVCCWCKRTLKEKPIKATDEATNRSTADCVASM